MMRILYLVHQFFPKHYTGTERFAFEVASQIQRMGHEPMFVTYEPSDDVNDFEKLTNEVMVKRYSYGSINVIALKHTSVSDPSEVFKHSIEEAGRRLSLESDIVHVCHPMWLSSIAKLCEERSTPMVMTLTDTWLLCPHMLLDRTHRLCNGPTADGGCTDCNMGRRMKSRLEHARIAYEMPDRLTAPSHICEEWMEQKHFRRTTWSKLLENEIRQ
jgi:glycosyltransferase involved in cell wall biosynthesis